MTLDSITSQPAAHKKNAQEEDKAETQEVTVRDFHDKGKTKKNEKTFPIG